MRIDLTLEEIEKAKTIFLGTKESEVFQKMHEIKETEILDIATFWRVIEELEKAKKFPPFASLHEGYAVLKEYVMNYSAISQADKVLESVKKLRNLEWAEKELIQIAAMAVKNLQLVETMKAEIQGKIL